MSQRKIQNYALDDLAGVATISVEEASRVIGISRSAAYEAVNRNEIASVRIGKRVRVLARPLYELLTGLVGTGSDN